MKQSHIITAEQEAYRFIETVKKLRERLAKDQGAREYFGIASIKETGAVRRASLDLTRSLAEMRKP
jgi:hypothetical protein